MKLYLAVILVALRVSQHEAASSSIGSSRIIGGAPALQGSWPFMVSFQNYTEVFFLWQRYPVYQHFCSGTIMADLITIITSAHCVQGITDFRNISVYAGVTNLQDTRGVRKMVVSCTRDPLYVAGNPGVGDVAACLLESAYVASLTTTAPTGQKIAAVAPVTKDAVLVINGTKCMVAGWGSVAMLNLGTGYYANALQELSVTILDVPSCNRMWPKITLNPLTFCSQQVAYNGNCFGDSGGPLICGAFGWVGIITAGNAICAVGQPDIYTMVSATFTIIP